MERLTVNLTDKTAKALSQVVDQSGDNKTDTVNRAIQVYRFIENVRAGGGRLLIQESPDAKPQEVIIF